MLFVLARILLGSNQVCCQDTTQQVTLIITDCVSVSPSEVDRILRLEIQSILSSRSISLRPTQLKISCMRDFFDLETIDNRTGKTAKRRIQISSKPSDGMERVMAIAVTELMLSSWEQFEFGVKNRDASGRDGAQQSGVVNQKDHLGNSKNNTANHGIKENEKDSIQASKKNEPRDIGLRISALWRIFPATSTNLFGGEIGGTYQLVGPLVLQAGIGAEGGYANRNLGSASLFSAGGSLGFGIHRRLFSSALLGTALLGFRGAYSSLNGKGESLMSQGYRLSGGVGGPMVRFIAAWATQPAVGLSAEVGYTVFDIEGNVDDGDNVAMKDLWVGVLLDLWVFKN